jgi:hypothetical protein
VKKLDSDTIIQTIRRSRKQVKGYGVKRIGLFGSYANGKPNPESDVDILVEFEPGQKTFDHYMDLKFFLEDKFARRVDLVIAENIKSRLRPSILSSVRYAEGS